MNRRFNQKSKLKAFLSLLYITAFLLSFGTVSASTFSRNIATTVQVNSETQVQVTQTHTLSWDNDSQFFPAKRNSIEAYIYPPLLGQIKDKDLASHIKNLRVVNDNGSILPFTTSVADGVFIVKVPYYQDLRSNRDLVFKLTYTTNLFVAKEGGLVDIMYAGLSPDFKRSEYYAKGRYTDKTNISVNFIIPKTLGDISSISPKPRSTSTKSDTVTLAFTDAELLDKSVRITLGNERLVKFTLSGKSYPTNSNSPDFVRDLLINYIEVALPTQKTGTEFANQTIYYTKIEPFPDSLRTDEDGNLIARLPVSAVKEGVITIEGYAAIRAVPLPESVKIKKISDIPATMAPYLANESTYWQVDDPAIQSLAKQNLDNSGLMFKTVQKSLGYVSKTLKYADVKSVDDLQRQGALAALQSKKGVCMEYSDLLLSILRAQGIPTRTVFGDGVGQLVDKTLQGIGHQWVSVWFPESGWVAIDPTWTDASREYIGPDFDHFVWYVASKSVLEPSGFHCQSLDGRTPCPDYLSIDTESVNALPEKSQLLSGEQLIQKVDLAKHQGSQLQQLLHQGTVYLGGSYFGRILLSTQGLLILFAIFVYVTLVFIISRAVTYIKKKRQKTIK